jgi:hypothetical protein
MLSLHPKLLRLMELLSVRIKLKVGAHNSYSLVGPRPSCPARE